MDKRPRTEKSGPSFGTARLAESFTAVLAAVTLSSCATMFPGLSGQKAATRMPISNPFGEVTNGIPSGYGDSSGNIVLRTRKGDRAVEVEIPGGSGELSSFVVPMSPSFHERGVASQGGSGGLIDERYRERRSTLTDREIANAMPAGEVAVSPDRQLVEQELGVIASAESAPQRDGSYLAAVDHVKQLYRNARFEAALLEVDDLLRLYPTDPKLHEMRGTLLDRTGRTDLALRSWNQAIALSPENASLRRFVERKQLTRSLAGQRPGASSKTPAPAEPALQEGATNP